MINLNIEEVDKETMQLVNAIEVKTTYVNSTLTEKEQHHYSTITLIKGEEDLLFQNFKLSNVHFILHHPEHGKTLCTLAIVGRRIDDRYAHGLGNSSTLLMCQIIGLRCEADMIIRDLNSIAEYLHNKGSNDLIFEIAKMERLARSYGTHCAYFVTNEDYRKNWRYYLLMMDKARREGTKPIEPPQLREL